MEDTPKKIKKKNKKISPFKFHQVLLKDPSCKLQVKRINKPYRIGLITWSNFGIHTCCIQNNIDKAKKMLLLHKKKELNKVHVKTLIMLKAIDTEIVHLNGQTKSTNK